MKKILLAFCLLLLPTYSLANPNPDKCPSVVSIQNVGLSKNLIQDANGHWFAGRTSQRYDTNNNWSFAIGSIPAPDKVKALQAAYDALATLSFVSGPEKGPAEKWVCVYQNDQEFPTAAVSPPITHLLFQE